MECERSGSWAGGGGARHPAAVSSSGTPRWPPSVAVGAADRVGSSHIKSKQPGRAWHGCCSNFIKNDPVVSSRDVKVLPSYIRLDLYTHGLAHLTQKQDQSEDQTALAHNGEVHQVSAVEPPPMGVEKESLARRAWLLLWIRYDILESVLN